MEYFREGVSQGISRKGYYGIYYAKGKLSVVGKGYDGMF